MDINIGVVSENYERGSRISEGSFARVYNVVSDSDKDGTFVIKHFSRSYNLDFSMIKEFVALTRMRSPNIVALQAGYVSFDQFWTVDLVMVKYSRTLHDLIKSDVQPAPTEIFRGLANALYVVHAHGFIHGDIKPQNILLTASNEVALADFGSSRWIGSMTWVPFEKHVTTMWYRAPELLLRYKYGQSIDVWSMGCVFHEYLSRKPLFPANIDETNESKLDMIRRIDLFLEKPHVPIAEYKDLIVGMLSVRNRLTAADVIKHLGLDRFPKVRRYPKSVRTVPNHDKSRITIVNWMLAIMIQAESSFDAMYLSIAMLDRLCLDDKVDKVCCMMMADGFLNINTHSSSEWAHITGIDRTELNRRLATRLNECVKLLLLQIPSMLIDFDKSFVSSPYFDEKDCKDRDKKDGKDVKTGGKNSLIAAILLTVLYDEGYMAYTESELVIAAEKIAFGESDEPNECMIFVISCIHKLSKFIQSGGELTLLDMYPSARGLFS